LPAYFLDIVLGTATGSLMMTRYSSTTRRQSTSSVTSATRSCTQLRGWPYTARKFTRRQ